MTVKELKEFLDNFVDSEKVYVSVWLDNKCIDCVIDNNICDDLGNEIYLHAFKE